MSTLEDPAAARSWRLRRAAAPVPRSHDTLPARSDARGKGRAARRTLMWIGPIVAFFVVWQLAAESGVIDASLLSPPTDVGPALWDITSSGQVFSDLGSSLARAGIGFAIASVAGVVIGLGIGWVPTLRGFVSPLAEVFRQLPPLALLPAFVLLLGLGMRSQVAMVIWAVIWPVLLSTVAGAATVDPRLIKAARSMGAGGWRLYAKVAFPGALPSIVTGLRLGASYALLVLVSAEMIGASSGIGYRIMEASNTYHIPTMYAYIVVLAAVGVALNYALLGIVRLAFPWMAR
ncbi:ABC transporter permease [Conexibacter sp. CPCC 206217]|uniref:ABC transporter permease n=1 Tax=Conexibacter sp. CPCC 206217 TaxID=3064574 RepID=UPI00271A30BB|nr:ABC transporter permease [Conexibacter sp. CPCC 206217]MDO8212638.1 ABC transporter permease [Conexibacter sp. CPCC 206217]